MIGDVCLPRRVLEADTIIVSCGPEILNVLPGQSSTLNSGGSHDELATAADYDKFVECFENNYTGVCGGRSVWLVDCGKLDGTDQDKNLKMDVGRNSRIMKSFLGSKDYHEQQGHLYVGTARFFSAKNVLIMICENGRRSSVANAESLRQILTLRFIDTPVRTRFLERHKR